MQNVSSRFTGSIPENYARYMEPLLFDTYAADLAGRVPLLSEGRILETAAGTGAVTRHLRDRMPAAVQIVATDLNQDMLSAAAHKFTSADNLRFQTADASALPFGDAEFDAALCQFGLMFFPDKPAALREMWRVLKPGAGFVFNVWDAIERNPLAHTVSETVADFLPGGAPEVLQVPFACHECAAIETMLEQAGFVDVEMSILPGVCESPSARDVALGFVTATPLHFEIMERASASLDDVITSIEDAVLRRHGGTPVRAETQSIVITARRPRST